MNKFSHLDDESIWEMPHGALIEIAEDIFLRHKIDIECLSLEFGGKTYADLENIVLAFSHGRVDTKQVHAIDFELSSANFDAKGDCFIRDLILLSFDYFRSGEEGINLRKHLDNLTTIKCVKKFALEFAIPTLLANIATIRNNNKNDGFKKRRPNQADPRAKQRPNSNGQTCRG